MSQKIYSDRTELEGVDLPGSGQTRMLVIDENKNIKSESKSSIPTKTSELENDSGFITSSSLTAENTSFDGTISALEADNVQDAIDEVVTMISEAGGGTVTSVGLTVPTGLSVSGSPITSSGTLAVTYSSGYQGYTTAEASKLSGIESGAQVNVPTNLAQGTRTSTTVPITSSTGTSATLEVATTTLAGVMSASDKTKLDGIEAGAQVNVQSDWNAVSGDAQILNKPTIPTKTSDLTNDSGFVTSSGVTSVSGTANQIVSTGGDTPTLSLHSDILASIELANTAIQSDDLATVATTGDYNDLDNLPTIPAQFNPTAGTGISITGTYPNLTFTNTSPNTVSTIDQVLGAGSTATGKTLTLTGGFWTGTYGYQSVNIGNPSTGNFINLDAASNTIKIKTGDYTNTISKITPTQDNHHYLPNKTGTLAHLSDIDEAINVKMFTIELTHSQVLELNTTPYNITSTDLGLQAGEKVKWLLDRCEWKVDGNGVPYDGQLRLYSPSSPICTFSIKGDGHRAGMNLLTMDSGYLVSDTHSLNAWGTITGGTSGATVKIRLYYTTTTW